ncbi:MAG: Nif11-like leader peptide family natural product precursor, partial [Sphaerospermopsis kisseleviana]
MEITKVEAFLNQIEEDEALQAELVQALEAENDREAVTELANSKGYDFSSDELWAEIQKRQAELEQKQTTGELSDEELEAVAGGGTVLMTIKLSIKVTIVASPSLP